MEPVNRLHPATLQRLHVKNTFFEVESDSDDSLDMDGSFARASTEPVKAMIPLKVPKEPLQAPTLGAVPEQMPYHTTGMTTSWGADPQELYGPDAVLEGSSWVQTGLRALEADPELAPVFESIRQGGMDAALRLSCNEDLMRMLSYKMGSASQNARGTALPGAAGACPVPAWAGGPAPAAAPLGVGGLLGSHPGMGQGAALAASPVTAATEPGLAANHAVSDATVREALSETIRKTACSVTVADPSLEDCPLISVSDGFEALTGYSRREVLGKNCRFLNRGVPMEPGVREALWLAVRTGTEFVGVLLNKRKNGEHFSNLLRMTTMQLRGKRYIIGVQADVTSVPIDLASAAHVEELRDLAKQILPNNLEAYIQMQVREYYMRQPPHGPQQLLRTDPATARAQEPPGARPHAGSAHKPQRGKKGEASRSKAVARVQDFSRAVSGTSDQSTSMQSTSVQSTSVQSTGAPSTADANERGEGSAGSAAAQGGQLKSIGSEGHPDSCHSECIFFFFRNGCNAGADCRFCHEFHWRKNMKKNRRILKRLASQADPAEDAGVAPGVAAA